MRNREGNTRRGVVTRRLTPLEWAAVGLGAGLLGGLALAAPIVIWDMIRSGHQALELPMAATAWLFGLGHFSQSEYFAWSSVVGVALLTAYAAVSGLIFTGLADRVYGVTRPLASMAAGFAWSFVSFIFFWYMVLPIARDGAPFRATAAAPGLFVAPNWVWILGFTLLGLITGAVYSVLRASARSDEVVEERTVPRSLHRRAA